jgi:hypothetical protein
MSQAQAATNEKPTMSWDDDTADNDEGFMLDTEAADVPKACSITEPDCESCQ